MTIDDLIARATLEEVVLRYCTAVDKLADVDDLVSLFTDDAVLDLTGLLLPRYTGHAAIRAFFTQVFADMSHHMHILSNLRVDSRTDESARVLAYVTGMGRSRAGIDIQVYVYYDLTLRKVAGDWKIASFYEAPKLPMPESVGAVHNKSA
ncbi:MAG: nuclear transport factor 2 family protein [Sphingomonadales bacterium]|nr:nuclear transport factor 2 family protein [Sphingomonadales bacterium]